MSTSVSSPLDSLSTKRKKHVIQALSLVVVALLWELTGQALGAVLFAPLSEVIPTYIDLAVNGEMFPVLGGTLRDMLIGYGLAVLFAVPTGLVMGRSMVADKTLNPWVSAMFVTSTSALLPMLIIIFGIGLQFRIVIVWLACVWHILLNVYHGAKGVDQMYVDVGRSFDVSSPRMFLTITLPATLPYVMAGLRMGISRAIRGVILAETYIIVGYGGLIATYGRQSITTESVLALILTIMFLGFALNNGLERLQQRFIPWADTDPSM
jgi:NitT/TauT family transport system permease protein